MWEGPNVLCWLWRWEKGYTNQKTQAACEELEKSKENACTLSYKKGMELNETHLECWPTEL